MLPFFIRLHKKNLRDGWAATTRTAFVSKYHLGTVRIEPDMLTRHFVARSKHVTVTLLGAVNSARFVSLSIAYYDDTDTFMGTIT